MAAGTRELPCRELSDFLADNFGGELGPNERALFKASRRGTLTPTGRSARGKSY
jgi:hypothetical protein